jgi:predicted nucleotidyltransferase
MRGLQRFLAMIARCQRIEVAYVCGSQAQGTATQWSDIDLAVVSSDFSADLFEERLALMRLAATVDYRIEPHPFTPEQFTATHPLAAEIQRTGVRILWLALIDSWSEASGAVHSRRRGSIVPSPR